MSFNLVCQFDRDSLPILSNCSSGFCIHILLLSYYVITINILVFFECGVGRIDHKGKWQMVSGMLRVAKNYSKPKVVKKKIKRYTGKEVELYVRKIRLDEGRLEVCTSLELLEEEIRTEQATAVGHLSLSQLRAGDEVVGTVVDVRSYGVMVDIGANRNGLLHIQKVADLYMRYIKKEEGLIKAGLVSILVLFRIMKEV